MAGNLLLDTGALVSLLDRTQRHHSAFTQVFESWKGSVLSSEAVLTEATHLLGEIQGGRRRLPKDFWKLRRPRDPEGRVLKALLEERASTR